MGCGRKLEHREETWYRENMQTLPKRSGFLTGLNNTTFLSEYNKSFISKAKGWVCFLFPLVPLSRCKNDEIYKRGKKKLNMMYIASTHYARGLISSNRVGFTYWLDMHYVKNVTSLVIYCICTEQMAHIY